ncbi:condensin subunit ScpA [Peptoniphilus asaccharolyticus DSM 20463]|uniref:Segregation and condensation protein A n=1 Tax=Peptoniphilus asaccharolyticus DSM 20463 TaxID=573058 RepID=A0A1W1UP58_PEPAS|nr:segregation/condensation protein A [Peptoniphilus asaccharolyticus]MBL7574948.1 segregation/condensation protein A [Peptoniphilus asaccharolyticus]SMB82494.1 condensin subunit ScpA [Peptoniphilus asaccharolyticus DSM 20463]
MSYNIELEIYNGPYDLILDLVKKNELDIYDIEINLITSQFLEYMKAVEELNLELTSDFIVMASTLLEIKSKMLLPKPVKKEDEEETEDPRDELVQKLLEYEKFKKATEILREQEKYEMKSFFKLKEDFSYLDDLSFLKEVDASKLAVTFNNILKRYGKKDELRIIPMEKFSVKKCMDNINKKLKLNVDFYFSELLSEFAMREEIVSYFLALLEMCKLQILTLTQNEELTDILVIPKQEESELNYGN